METYTQAIADVDAGKIAWRAAWPDQTRYIQLKGAAVYVFSSSFINGQPYSPTTEDQNGSDWSHSDKPPRP